MAKKNNKVEWQGAHKCIKCKKTSNFLLCEHCGNISVKVKK